LALDLYVDRQYSIILDCTGFVANSEIPLRWLKYCAELIPSDIRSQWLTTHILNPNALTQKFLRRLYNVAAGTSFCGDIKVWSWVDDLLKVVPEGVSDGLSATCKAAFLYLTYSISDECLQGTWNKRISKDLTT
jgi:hypothetical protein